jgi:hypothetical protein
MSPDTDLISRNRVAPLVVTLPLTLSAVSSPRTFVTRTSPETLRNVAVAPVGICTV